MTRISAPDHVGLATAEGFFVRRPLEAMASVGATLAAARSATGRSLADLAETLGVPVRLLSALENDDFQQLPGLVYEKRLIRRYAITLGLAPDALVKAWSDVRSEAIDPAASFVRRLSWSDVRVSPLVWRRIATVLAVLIIGLYLGGRFLAMLRPPALTVNTPIASVSMADRVVLVTGNVEPGAVVTVNSQPVATDAKGAFEAPVTLTAGPNIIRVSATRRYGRPSIVERQVYVDTTPALVGT